MQKDDKSNNEKNPLKDDSFFEPDIFEPEPLFNDDYLKFPFNFPEDDLKFEDNPLIQKRNRSEQENEQKNPTENNNTLFPQSPLNKHPKFRTVQRKKNTKRMDKPKPAKPPKSFFSSGSAEFIRKALGSFSSSDEMVVLSALTELCSELSMANDSVGEDENCNELIRQLILLLDKYPFLPDISLWVLNCLNYLLDINPRATNTIIKFNGIGKIVKQSENMDYIDCVESAIKAIEKMSYENVFALVEKGAFISVLAFIDFFDMNLRKIALKACVNMSKAGNSLDYVKKNIMPAIQGLTMLTKLNGNSEIEKTIADFAIQCFYNIVSGTKNYNVSCDLNDFCDSIIRFGLMDNLFELFAGFINIEDELGNRNIISSTSAFNVNVETIKTILKLFEAFCQISHKIANYLLRQNTLELIYKVLYKELASVSKKDNKANYTSANKKPKLSSSSHSLYDEIFKLLISFFPGRNLNKGNTSLNKIMSKDNLNYFLYFSEKILTLIIDNILHIPSTNTTLGIIKLISMYCANSPIEYIKKYIKSEQLSNSLGKMLDSKDSSYILEVFSLVDLIMTKVPEYFFILFIREGVVDNIKRLQEVEENSIYITKETTISLKGMNSDSSLKDEKFPSDSIKCKGFNKQISESSVINVIRGNAKVIMRKYFSSEIIAQLISNTKKQNELDPLEIMNKLEKYRDMLKEKTANETTIREIIDLLIKNNVTFFEIEKSEIVFYLCFYLDEAFVDNYNNAIDDQIRTEVTLVERYNKNIIQKLHSFFKAFNNKSNEIVKFLQILQQCISSMNCFKLYLYEYDSLKSTSNLFLSAFSGVSLSKLGPKIPLNFSFDSSNDETKKMLNDIKRENKYIYKLLDFYINNKKTRICFDSETKFEEIPEVILKYPNKKNSFDNVGDYMNEVLKIMIQKDISDEENLLSGATIELPKTINQKRKEREQKKKIPKQSESIKNKDDNNNSFTMEEEQEQSQDKEEQQNEKDNEEIFGFLSKYTFEFWVQLSKGGKYNIKQKFTINEFLLDAKISIPRPDFLMLCNNLPIFFTLTKNEQKLLVSPNISSKMSTNVEFLSKLSYDIKDIKNGLVTKRIFEQFYYDYIINNKALYNIKRASPFFYLIILINLCEKTFPYYFNLDNIPSQIYENLKMSSLLFKQVKEPNSINSKSIPSWCREVNMNYPFFTNFSSRYLLFKSTAFETKRSMINLYIFLRNFLGENIFEDKPIKTLTAASSRTKIKIHREKILEEAYILSNQFINFKGYLEFEYYNESGTGMGPTLEFYSLFFKEIMQLKNLWYKTEDYSVFPLPLIGENEQSISKIKELFSSLGYVIARGIYDDRLIDIPINSVFWDLVLNRPISYLSLEKVDKYIFKFIDNQIRGKNSSNDLEKSDIYFTLPWNVNKSLIDQGSNIKLSEDNFNQYSWEVMNKMLIEGQKEIIDSFVHGFNKVFNINELKCFTSSEIEEVICGAIGNDDSNWAYDILIQNIIPMHGFTKESLVYKGLIDILTKMSKMERKMFLLFVTGSPRLPIGGFKNLYPKLTVVMFQSEYQNASNLLDSPDNHLPSVMTCQNYLKIPNYSSVNVLKAKLLTAINEGNNAFHLS